MPCVKVHDQPYSLMIRKTPKPGMATGAWERLISSNIGVPETTVQLITSRSEGSTQSTTNTVSNSISASAGLEFSPPTGLKDEDGEDIESGITASAEVGFTHDDTTEALNEAKKELSQTEDMTTTVKCPDIGNNGASVYQWVVTSADGMETLKTLQTICRDDADHRLKPVCLPMKCANKACSECRA